MEQGTATKTPLVANEINLAEELVEQIHKQITELESRLLVVLVPESPMVNGNEGKVIPTNVPLADRLQMINDQLRAARERISLLRIRIEL